jgi:hypothetical protein
MLAGSVMLKTNASAEELSPELRNERLQLSREWKFTAIIDMKKSLRGFSWPSAEFIEGRERIA